jgi:hypothetical protein
MPQGPEAVVDDERDEFPGALTQCRKELFAGHIGMRGE